MGHIYIHTYMHTYIDTYIHTHMTHTYIRIYIHTDRHALKGRVDDLLHMLTYADVCVQQGHSGSGGLFKDISNTRS